MSGRKRRRPRPPDGEVAGRVRGGYCYFAFEWQFLSSALISENDRNILFRVNSPGAAWCSLVDIYSLETQGASLDLHHKLDSVRSGANDDLTLKLSEMEVIARSLRSSHSQWQYLTESFVIGKFVNTLSCEHDIQKQMLEEREDGFSREAIVSSVQKRFESSVCKQLHHSKLKSGTFKPSRSSAGVRITPAAVDLVAAVESQVDYRAAVETAAAVGPAETAARVAEVSRVGELAAAAVAPRPRSPGKGRAGCARATCITSVTASNRSARSVARGATTQPSAERWRRR